MKFREATPEDISQLLLLEQAVVEAERPFNSTIKSEGATYYQLDELIDGNNSFLLVAEEGSQIIATGYAQIRDSKPALQHDKHSYLGFMYVAPNYRGKGLNKQLLDQLVEWSQEKGINDFYLDVYYENTPAINAYKKAGFEPSMLEMKLHL